MANLVGMRMNRTSLGGGAWNNYAHQHGSLDTAAVGTGLIAPCSTPAQITHDRRGQIDKCIYLTRTSSKQSTVDHEILT